MFMYVCVCGVIWPACGAEVWPNVQMQTQTGHKQVRTGIRSDTNGMGAGPHGYTRRYGRVSVQIITGIRLDTILTGDTFRYGQGYVQIRTGIRTGTKGISVDTDKDTYRYKQNTYRYGQMSEHVLKYVRIRTQKKVNKYVRIPPVRIRMYLFHIRTEYVHGKRLMARGGFTNLP